MFRSAGARRDFFRLARSINISLRWSEGKAKSGRKRPFLTCQVLKLGRCYQRKGCYLVLPDHQAKAAVLMKSLRATFKDNAFVSRKSWYNDNDSHFACVSILKN